MHGIQQIFRQHEIEKQSSIDSWQSSLSSTSGKGNDSNMDFPWNQGSMTFCG